MIINLENALAVARDPGGRSRDELVVSAAYLASEVEKLQAQLASAREKCVEVAQAGFDSCGLREVEAVLAVES